MLDVCRPEALLVFERSTGALSYLNAEAVSLVGLRDDRVAKFRAVDLLPALIDLTPRTFAARLETVAGLRDVSLRLEELRPGPFAAPSAVAVTIALPPERPAAQRAERLEALWDVVVRQGFAGTGQMSAILRESARGMGLERATLGRVDGERVIAAHSDAGPVADGDVALETAAVAAARASGTYAVLDALEVPEFAVANPTTRCLLVARFSVSGEPYVLSLSSSQPRAARFTSDDWRYVETVVETLSRGVERLETDARIEVLAYSDTLTSLPNRIALLRRIDEALRESQRLPGRTAILFIDIDGFKTVNDTVGHRGGDVVLAEIAQRFRGTLRREEFIGRLGGDEFAVVMAHFADRSEIESIAQRLGAVLTFPFRVGDYRFALSASIGIAIYPDDATTRDELLACADAAMYSVKDDGGSRARFCDELARPANSDAAPASAVASVAAIGYVLCYQPIVELRTGRVIAAEALVRRIHPVHGLLAPSRAWSLARDDAGRRALDRWLLRGVTSQARTWDEAGTPIRVDVNLSFLDLREIDEVRADEGLKADLRRLRVGVTPEQCIDVGTASQLAALAGYCATHGIGFALDGFDGRLGMLGSLAQVPLDCIKLDRSLVDLIVVAGPARSIVEGTIAAAKSLGWDVVAKGVETAQQQEALVSLGCDGIQGSYVAHPMTAVDFGGWLLTRRLIGREA